MKYQAVIGLEIHVQLSTESKVFCSCSTEFGNEPNTQICPVCLGLPGTLPVLNEKAFDLILKVAAALKCSISYKTKFDRKNYFYPDLPKNYQISQFDFPIAYKGSISICPDGKGKKKITITRIHLEEDAGKLVHASGDYSLVDYNRAGTPLMEIVTEPELNSPQEAFDFLEKLKSIIRYLEVSDCNMEEGSLRCDANVSIRPEGTEEYGVKTEVKNMNSFKGVRNALSYEIDRQKQVLNKFGRIVQETRLWDETKKITMPMRSKEEAHDYRYFPEPDLVYFNIDKDKIAQVGQLIPELPEEKKERFKNDYNLPEYDAGVLTAEKDISDFFDECCSYYDDYKLISNWFMGQVMETLNENKITISKLNVSPENLSGLIRLLGENKINVSTAKNVFEKMIKTNKTALNIVQEENLTQISDGSELKKFAHQVIEENQKSADDFKSGKKQALMYLVGQVMRKTKGKADAKIVKDILETMLK